MEKDLKEYEEELWFELITKHCFWVIGDATDFIEKWASSKGVEILSMELHSIEDVRGESVIVTDATCFISTRPCWRNSRGVRVVISDVANPYFCRRYWWLDMAKDHPEKKYLMLFYVEEADIRAINALKSFIENKPENLFYGIICRDSNKKVKTNNTYRLLGRPIKWGEEE